MTSKLVELCVDTSDPEDLARFWGGLLGWERGEAYVGTALEPTDDTGFRLRFVPSTEPRRGPNQMHFDLDPKTDEAQAQKVALALWLGATHLDVGQTPEEGHVVLADPDGNEMCILEGGNNFLRGCPFVGGVSGDGLEDVGRFWSAALDWPLVWDQDGETAVQSPHGGPKVTWGGEPVNPKLGKNRLHWHVEPVGLSLAEEVSRLESLGATRADIGQGDVPWVVMADPGGNEFCVLPG